MTSSYEHSLYSVSQQKALVGVPIISGFLSTVGSGIILTIILRDWRNKLAHTYHRLLFALSVIDLVSSLNQAVAGLAIPKGQFWGAIGNITTCNISGFLIELGSATQLYNVGVIVYYLLVIRFHVTQSFIKKNVEPYIHAIAMAKPIAFGITALSLKSFNPLLVIGGVCWIQEYPAGCIYEDDVACERGEHSQLLAILSIGCTNLVGMLIMVVASVLIIFHVRHTDQTSVNNDTTELGPSGHRTRQACIQAFLYIAAYFATYITLFSALFKDETSFKSVTNQFVLSLFIKIFFPLQGVWNCLIYVRPQFVAMTLKANRLGQKPLGFSTFLYQSVFPPKADISLHFAPEIVSIDDDDEFKAQDRSSELFFGPSEPNNNNVDESVIEKYIRPSAFNDTECNNISDSSRPMGIEDAASLDASLFENSDDDEETARLRKIFFSY